MRMKEIIVLRVSPAYKWSSTVMSHDLLKFCLIGIIIGEEGGRRRTNSNKELHQLCINVQY